MTNDLKKEIDKLLKIEFKPIYIWEKIKRRKNEKTKNKKK